MSTLPFNYMEQKTVAQSVRKDRFFTYLIAFFTYATLMMAIMDNNKTRQF